jgi:hypothetical protein
MKLKQAILTIMDPDMLKAMVGALELEDVDRRSVEDMRAKMARSRRAAPEILLAHLSEKQVKAVCELMGVSSKGRRRELMERLLNITGAEVQIPEKQLLARSAKIAKENSKQAQKEFPAMVDKQNTANQNEPQTTVARLPDPPACASHLSASQTRQAGADRPPGMLRVTRTELVWPGKYNEDGTLKDVPRVRLPFQAIETVNETRATREAKKGGI